MCYVFDRKQARYVLSFFLIAFDVPDRYGILTEVSQIASFFSCVQFAFWDLFSSIWPVTVFQNDCMEALYFLFVCDIVVAQLIHSDD